MPIATLGPSACHDPPGVQHLMHGTRDTRHVTLWLPPSPLFQNRIVQGDYTRGHYECLPYDDSSMRSLYHVRDFEVYRLMQVRGAVQLYNCFLMLGQYIADVHVQHQ